MSATPPFRAEHVGSLLRPERLREARAKAEGEIYRSATEPLRDPGLAALEDDAVRDAIRLQEEVGLQVITDGELRRRSWFQDFVLSLEGPKVTWVDATQGVSAAMPFQTDSSVEKLPGHIIEVKSRLKRNGGIFTEHFKFLRAATKRATKVSIPSPTQLHFWGGRACIDRTVYPDIEAFWDDAIAAWVAEIKDLHALGCRYVQIDDVTFAILCDPRAQEVIGAGGDDPGDVMQIYARVLNRILAESPQDITFAMHMCRGNNRGRWMGQGGYEFVSEAVFQALDMPNYFMEYDTNRAGDFRPLRHLPKGKKVVLGLVSTKTPVLEQKDALKRRIDEAAKFAPLEQLCLSPQCGFASNFLGNPLTVDDERRKLALVVETAHDVWG